MSLKCFQDIYLTLCEELDTPRALTAAMLWRHKEYDQLLDLKVDPAHYRSTEAGKLRSDLAATELLRKCADIPSAADPKAAALAAWWEAEAQCSRSNVEMQRLLHGPHGPEDERLLAFVGRVRAYISHVLGPLPSDLEGRFGPGATLSDNGRCVSVPDKTSSIPTMTASVVCMLPHWGKTLWSRMLDEAFPQASRPVVVRGNRFTTVPKDARKDRGIAIEPSLNGFYQLGVGAILRSRLLRAGIDLQHGQETHRRVAEESSLSGEYATIDLSSASDTISKDLVRLLLPPLWLTLLDSFRAPVTQVGSHVVYLNKYSSMGNGYTFELETLIFLALIKCLDDDLVPGLNLWVYGDDIIVPSSKSADTLGVLRYFGFTPNPRKTFTTGLFRESCGGDFFNGVPVRAHYLKSLPSCPSDWMALANGLRARLGFESIRRTWFKILDQIPSQVRRLRGPASFGDVVIHDSPDKWTVRIRDSIRYVLCWTPVGQTRNLDSYPNWAVFAAAVYGMRTQPGRKPGSRQRIPVRGDVRGYIARYQPYS